MYNLLLIDDEQIALNGLSNYIDWENMGFCIKGTVPSIAEAKTVLSQEKIHVVLTDIELEQESGLDLIKWIKASYPEILCVVLTGHRSFEYAQRALRYGVFDFLVKPVQFDVLRQTFSRIKEKLENSEHTSQKSAEFVQLKKTNLFNHCITDKTFIPDESSLVQLGIPRCSCMFLARVCLMDKNLLPDCTKKFLFSQLKKQYQWKYEPDSFVINASEITVIFYDISEEVLLNQMSAFQQNCSLMLQIGISNSFSSFAEMCLAYKQAGQALDYAFWNHETPLVWFHDIQTLEGNRYTFSAELKAAFMECLERKDLSQMTELVNRELENLCHSSNRINLLHSFCVELLMFMTHFLRSHLPGYSGSEIIQMVRQIISLTQQDDICAYLRSCLFSLWSMVKEITVHNSDTLMQIQEYINQHYMDNITLQHLSEVFFINPNYLSRMFKEKTGGNFIDYLTSVRIEKAKDLLENSDLKISEISLTVGYETSKYFSSVFKEKCGITPKEYRAAHQI